MIIIKRSRNLLLIEQRPTFESRFNLNLLQLLLYGFARSIARFTLCMFSPKDGLSVL